jgi:hypothetical protein
MELEESDGWWIEMDVEEKTLLFFKVLFRNLNKGTWLNYEKTSFKIWRVPVKIRTQRLLCQKAVKDRNSNLWAHRSFKNVLESSDIL